MNSSTATLDVTLRSHMSVLAHNRSVESQASNKLIDIHMNVRRRPASHLRHRCSFRKLRNLRSYSPAQAAAGQAGAKILDARRGLRALAFHGAHMRIVSMIRLVSSTSRTGMAFTPASITA